MKLDKELRKFLIYEISNYNKYKSELKKIASSGIIANYQYTVQYVKRMELTVNAIDEVLNSLSPDHKLIFDCLLLQKCTDVNLLSNKLNYSISTISRCKNKFITDVAKGLGIIA